MALTNLGAMYMSGRGVTESHEQALGYFKRAANHNNPEAQVNLGSMYYRMLMMSNERESESVSQ
jgi:uncharacterized protein